MNSIQKLTLSAGQKVHEQVFGARFEFLGKEYPCSHGAVGKALDLGTGGFTENLVVMVQVRTELFNNGILPAEENSCKLKVGDESDWISLRIKNVETHAGGQILVLTCHASREA